jgi:hypothetical protein
MVAGVTTIKVTSPGNTRYAVTVEDNEGVSVHEVTVTPAHVDRYAPGATPEALVEASFRFLLEHEPKHAILAQFDLPVIERYFPDYPSEVRRHL